MSISYEALRFTVTVTGKTLDDVKRNADEKCAALFGDGPYQLISLDVEERWTLDGKEFLWYEAKVTAEEPYGVAAR